MKQVNKFNKKFDDANFFLIRIINYRFFWMPYTIYIYIFFMCILMYVNSCKRIQISFQHGIGLIACLADSEMTFRL